MYDHDYKKYPELTNAQLQQLQFSSPFPQITEDFFATVVKVHDGDTITLRTEFRDFDFKLRLLDIDAPELNAGGEIARDWLQSRILNRNVQILIDRYRRVGKYGRLLGKVEHGGMTMGEQMLHLGLAKEFINRKEGLIPNAIELWREHAIPADWTA